jgi:hypothetical protein
MRIGESRRLRSTATGYIYVLLSSLAGVWQWWCADYGRDNFLTVTLGALMSLPFALASYAHASLFNSTIVTRPNWKRIFILWAGMPFSFAIASLTILAQTRIMYAIGLGIDNLPYDSVRLMIGEGAACLVWATVCWHGPQNRALGCQATAFSHCLPSSLQVFFRRTPYRIWY